MLVTPLVLIQVFSKRMLTDWPKCGSDPRDEVSWHVCYCRCYMSATAGATTSMWSVHVQAVCV